MAFEKKSSKLSVTQSKKVQKAMQKAKSRPWLTIGLIALLPLVALLAVTCTSSPAHKNSQAVAKKAETIIARQTPQELAEEATQALRKKDMVAFFELLDTKIQDPNLVNNYGDSLLIVAATLGNFEAVERLLSLGADVNKQNYNTRDTAILRSVYGDHDEVTKLLVYERADLNLPNNYGQTPMGLAVEKQNGELVDLFLVSGVKAGLDGETLLRSAAQQNYVGVVAMLKGGVNPDTKNAAGNTPLIISASLGDTASVNALLAYRANVNAENNDGNTALLYAARYNHPDTVMAILAPLTMQYRADINAKNKNGETALYWAAQKGYAPIVRILLAYDADKTIKTNAGMTALDVAKKFKRTEVIKLLKMNLNKLKTEFNADLQAGQEAATDERSAAAQ